MVSVDDCNNGMRARTLKLKFGHDAMRNPNTRLSTWHDYVANRAFVFTYRRERREASLAAGLLAFTGGRPGAPCRIGPSRCAPRSVPPQLPGADPLWRRAPLDL